MSRRPDARQGRPELPVRMWQAALAGLLALALLGACASGDGLPAAEPDQPAAASVEVPEQCRGDGAVQTWLLLPVEEKPSELLAAYQDRQVIEFQATVIGQDDNPALQPHRRFLLREAAEGVILWLDYQGDPPPLIQGQSYRFIAWADLVNSGQAAQRGAPGQATAASGAPESTPERYADIPPSRGYEMQIFDSVGLLFLGRTDVEEQDDALGLQLVDAPGDCPAVPARQGQNACVLSRTTAPLAVRWDGEELVLHPGEDGMMAHRDAIYSVALFRNRQVIYVDPPCAAYNEHRRSLRIDRVDPLPVLPAPLPLTGTITTTLPLTRTAPLTGPVPLPAAP